MSRRGRSGPTISLFSFQDIITSVTAIITVVTLLLALDLVQRRESSASDLPATLATDLKERLEAAEKELDELRTSVASVDSFVQDAAGQSPAELKTEIAARESAIAELQARRAKLKQQQTILKAQEVQARHEQFDQAPLKEQLADAEQAAETITEQIGDLQSDHRTIFTLPRGMQKEGWIVVIEAKRIAAAPLGRATPPSVFETKGFGLLGASAGSQFETWIGEQQLKDAYFLLLVRPGGTDTLDEILKQFERSGISHGFDLIDADESILHPERGAAP